MELSTLTRATMSMIKRRGRVGDHRRRSGSVGAVDLNHDYIARMSYLEGHRYERPVGTTSGGHLKRRLARAGRSIYRYFAWIRIVVFGGYHGFDTRALSAIHVETDGRKDEGGCTAEASQYE